ncbi:TonB domain-containing protein [Rhodovulum sulfidophilum]|uniref:TonB domain-containing protein n=1 Tax=Rhodovulum sulfidophilum TaxID=35806 RepID=A0A0D6B619_RHOSU|nr:TonB domain-containing protein [Rhodovulum sulfidophilum]
MNTGTYISGGAHLGLIAWVMLAGLFEAPPPKPMEVSDVTILSGDEFAALTAPAAAPKPSQEIAPPEAPSLPSSPRPAPAPEARPQRPAPPVPQEAAEPDPAPEALEPPAEADVAETVTAPEAPEIPDAPEAPVTDTAPPRPSTRIAPEPSAPPPEDAVLAEQPSQATRPDPAAESPQPEADEAAPEEAATQTVTEAEEQPETGLAMAASPRPRTRPNRPAAPPPEETAAASETPEAPAEPASEEDDLADAVADAVADAMSEPAAAPEGTGGAGRAASGPPLTGGERDALRVAVSRCWNVGSLSTDALQTSVVVGVDMEETGKPDIGSIRMVSWSGGSETAARQTYESARRAIVMCGSSGFPLPVEKYDQWRQIEMTFDPGKMRIR